VRVRAPVEEGVTEVVVVLVSLRLEDPVILVRPVEERRGERLAVGDWLDVLDARVE
jgi:hypothetical protein